MPDAPNPNADASKLIVDTDWKAQAQAEKEKLAQKAAATKSAGPSLKVPGAAAAGVPGATTSAAAAGGADAGEEIKPFDELLRMLAMQALSFLGEMPDPRTGQRMFAPEYARLYIDMMSSLESRTKGNLSAEEQEMLTGLLSDLRMTWVEMTKAVAKAVQEGKIKTVQPGAAGIGGPGGVAGPGIVTPGNM